MLEDQSPKCKVQSLPYFSAIPLHILSSLNPKFPSPPLFLSVEACPPWNSQPDSRITPRGSMTSGYVSTTLLPLLKIPVFSSPNSGRRSADGQTKVHGQRFERGSQHSASRNVHQVSLKSRRPRRDHQVVSRGLVWPRETNHQALSAPNVSSLQKRSRKPRLFE